MEIEVQIDAEQVNKHVTEAILNSTLGAKLKEAIEKSVNDTSSGYNRYGLGSVIEEVVKNEVRNVIMELIRTQYQHVIEEGVKAKLTEDYVGKMFEKLWDASQR